MPQPSPPVPKAASSWVRGAAAFSCSSHHLHATLLSASHSPSCARCRSASRARAAASSLCIEETCLPPERIAYAHRRWGRSARNRIALRALEVAADLVELLEGMAAWPGRDSCGREPRGTVSLYVTNYDLRTEWALTAR